MTFQELGLDEQLIEAIGYMGFTEATPVQAEVIPDIIKKRDVIACAQTGTGKTGAFVIPTLQLLAQEPSEHTSTLIVSPTRELAIQIEQQVQALGYFLGVSSLAVYGGGDGAGFTEQKKALTSGTNVIVATPGKLISHLNLGYVKFDQVSHLILDEADRMLDMNFYDDIQRIIKYLPNLKHTSMFSATMSSSIKKLAKQLLTDPKEVILELSKPAEGVMQAAYVLHEKQKVPVIESLIKGKESLESIIIFSSTKKKVGDIVASLKKAGEKVAGISSNLDQSTREEVMQQFRAKQIRVLVGTDVISRGIDVKDINLVINYDVPNEAEDYVHRVGRTARAKTTGIAITLVTPPDMQKMGKIEELIEQVVNKLPLPQGMEPGPTYNPNLRVKKHGGHRSKKHHHRKGKRR